MLRFIESNGAEFPAAIIESNVIEFSSGQVLSLKRNHPKKEIRRVNLAIVLDRNGDPTKGQYG